MIKTYLTISDKFFVPNLMHYLRLYLKACHICQLARNDKPTLRQLQTRINYKYEGERSQKTDVRCQKMGRRRKTCEDKRDNVKVIQNPEMKIVCTININIEIEILNEGYK